MSSRRISYKKKALRESYHLPLSSEQHVLHKSSEIIHILYSACQTTQKVNFSRSSDVLLMKQVFNIGHTLASYINCGPCGEVPVAVSEALTLWQSIEADLRQLLINIEDGFLGSSV